MRKRRRRRISIASLKIRQRFIKSGGSFDDDLKNEAFDEEETSSSSSEEFLESGFEFSLGVFSSSSSRGVDNALVTDTTETPSVVVVVEEEEDEEEEEEEEEEFVVRLSYAFDISNALVRSRLGTMMIRNDNENNNEDKDKEEVLKTMVFTLKEERFTYEQKVNTDASTTTRNSIKLSVDAHEMQKILERVPLRVKENTACVFVETMKREDDTPTNTTTRENTKKYIVDDRLTVVAKHFRCEETGKLKRQFVNPFV